MSGDADWIAWGDLWMGGPFRIFDTHYAIFGLAKDERGVFDILALETRAKMTGNASRFLAAAMDSFRTIRVFEVYNPALDAALLRRGFRRCRERPADDLPYHSGALRWDRP